MEEYEKIRMKILKCWARNIGDIGQIPEDLSDEPDVDIHVDTLLSEMGCAGRPQTLTLERVMHHLRELERNERDKQIVQIQKKQTFYNGIILMATITLAFGSIAQVLVHYGLSLVLFYVSLFTLMILSDSIIVMTFLLVYNNFTKKA
ncbi:hypothetical protein KAT24_00140 [Candidatus Pacearchaeota archaeon]|nr:hypothetical protein [Candidatus Pacearchaeota archaeon]